MVSRLAFVTVALVVVCSLAQQKPPPMACQKAEVEKKFKACLASGKPAANCRTAFAEAMKRAAGCNGKTPDAVEMNTIQQGVAREAMAKCRMANAKNATKCDKAYEAMSGKTLPKDATSKANKDRFEAERGGATALADKMKDCKNTTCQEKARKEMADLKGRNVSKQEFQYDLRKAGAAKGGDFITDCMQNATDAAEKKKCLDDPKAKEAFAKAAGKDAKDIKDVDIKNAARQQATKNVRDTMGACTSAASTEADKKKCFQRDDLKSAIGDSKGKMAGDVKDSDVRQYVERGARDDMLTAAKTCNKTDLAKCKAEMKDVMAAATGRNASDITDDSLQRDAKKAMASDLGDRMTACAEDAGNDKTAMAACRSSIAKEEMKRADFTSGGKEPSKVAIEKGLRDAGKEKARTVMQDCTKTRAECMTVMQESTAKSMGKMTSDVKPSEAEKLNRAGAFSAAREMAETCAAARKANASATCEDPIKKYLEVRKISEKTDPKAKDVQRNQIVQGAARDAEKDIRKVCYEKATKALADTCLQGFQSSKDETMKQLYSGLNDADRTKRVKTASLEASREVVGEDFSACMKAAAGDKTEKDKCMVTLKAKKDVAGLTAKPEDIVKMYRGQEVAKASQACVDAGTKKTCRADAKQTALDTGMQEREWASVKRTGEKEAAAKAWAACKINATMSDADCLAAAKDSFAEVSGSSDAAAWTDIKDRIVKLGKAKRDGVALKLVKKRQIDIDGQTSATACSDALKKAFNDKVKDLLGKSKVQNKTLSKVGSRGVGCRIVDDTAELSSAIGAEGLNDTQIDAAADEAAALLKGISLTTRRLLASERNLASVSVTSTYASQGTELCASDDSSCGTTSDLATTTGTATSGTTTTGTAMSSTATSGTATSGAATSGVSSGARNLALNSMIASAFIGATFLF